MSKKTKLLVCLIGGIALGPFTISLCLPPSTDLSVSFVRYQNTTAFLVFSNNTRSDIVCWWDGIWWEGTNPWIVSPRSPAWKSRMSVPGKNTREMTVAPVPLAQLSQPCAVGFECITRPWGLKLKVESFFHTALGFDDSIFPRKTFNVLVALPPIPSLATNQPAKAGFKVSGEPSNAVWEAGQ